MITSALQIDLHASIAYSAIMLMVYSIYLGMHLLLIFEIFCLTMFQIIIVSIGIYVKSTK